MVMSQKIKTPQPESPAVERLTLPLRSRLYHGGISEIYVSDSHGNFAVIRGPYFQVHGVKEVTHE